MCIQTRTLNQQRFSLMGHHSPRPRTENLTMCLCGRLGVKMFDLYKLLQKFMSLLIQKMLKKFCCLTSSELPAILEYRLWNKQLPWCSRPSGVPRASVDGLQTH